MALFVLCFIFQKLFFLVSANQILTINPQYPVVPLGGSIQLNCSINKPSCTTNWKGLDTDLGNIFSAPGYSILTFENAVVHMEATRNCVEVCPGHGNKKHNQIKSVFLQVYALPDTLILSTSITSGIPYLHCLMKGVHPLDEIKIQCYKGSEKLDNYSEDITEDEDLGTYNVTWSWEISNEDLQSQTVYRCESELIANYQTFRRVGTLETPTEVKTTETTRTASSNKDENIAITTRTSVMFSEHMHPTSSYIRSIKEITSSPPSATSRSFPEELFTTEPVGTTDSLAIAVTSTGNQTQLTTTRMPTTHRTALSVSIEITSLTAHTFPPPVNEDSSTETLTTTTENQKKTIQTSNESSTNSAPTPSYPKTPEKTTSLPTSTLISRLPTDTDLSTTHTVTEPNTETTEIQKITIQTSNKFSTGSAPTPSYPRTPEKITSSPPSMMISRLPIDKDFPSTNTDEVSIMWMAVPTAGLVGSILIVWQIWRHLNKKGFFQPNKMHWSDSKYDTKDPACSLETEPSHYISFR